MQYIVFIKVSYGSNINYVKTNKLISEKSLLKIVEYGI